MTSPRRRNAAIALTTAEASGLTALLTMLDEFLRSSPAVTVGPAEFLRAREARFPGFEACNLIDELSFTALGYRSRLADDDSTDPDQETR
jgi:hypothetical protein